MDQNPESVILLREIRALLKSSAERQAASIEQQRISVERQATMLRLYKGALLVVGVLAAVLLWQIWPAMSAAR